MNNVITSVFLAFKMIEGDQAILQKAVYFLGNLVGVVLAVYKCQVMGLLPTHPSDWLAFVEPQKVRNCNKSVYWFSLFSMLSTLQKKIVKYHYLVNNVFFKQLEEKHYSPNT